MTPDRFDWPDKKIEKLAFSMGLFVLYFGTTKQYPDVAHHTIILGEKYKDLLHEMFDLKQLEPSDFSVYLHRPTATDPSMAPAGCDAFYVLVPVPNLQGGQDWSQIGDDYRDRVVAYLERTHLPGLRDCITEDFYVTPNHFRDELELAARGRLRHPADVHPVAPTGGSTTRATTWPACTSSGPAPTRGPACRACSARPRSSNASSRPPPTAARRWQDKK